MPVITQIAENHRTPTRRRIFLDGRPAFNCGLNVVARFRLRVGMELDQAAVDQILQGEVRQECVDAALHLISRRLHSRSELFRKLTRGRFEAGMVDAVLDDLARQGYVDDQKFAQAKAQAAAQRRHLGRRGAFADLMKSGVKRDVAESALDEVYDRNDTLAIARRLAEKAAPRLRKLDPQVARRRLAGMLGRRGFDYEQIKQVIQETLGGADADE